MTIDTWLGLFGTLSGLIGLFLAYYFYKKSIRTKVLAISYTDPIPLMMTMGDLEVVYEGASLRALSRVYLLFWNRGTAPIEASDFLAPIVITTSKPILSLEIHDKDAAVAAVLDEKTKSISIGLLRPGEAITLVAEVTSEVYRPDISVQMKSADMSAFISGHRITYPAFAGLFTALMLIFMEGILLYSWAPPSHLPPPPPPDFFPDNPWLFGLVSMFFLVGGVLVLGFFPILLGVVVQKLTKRIMSRTTTPVAWNFFELKFSAWAIRLRLKDFRKFIDAEYKKIAPN
jgi:hypothetical protein